MTAACILGIDPGLTGACAFEFRQHMNKKSPDRSRGQFDTFSHSGARTPDTQERNNPHAFG
jgi:hypothetical protein